MIGSTKTGFSPASIIPDFAQSVTLNSFEEHVSRLVKEVLEKFEDVEIRRSLDFCATKFEDQLQD